jgi:SAM-dependent methyltransferase
MTPASPSSAQQRGASIPDEVWFQLQFKPEEGRERYGIPIPNLPPDDVQQRFTGASGQRNLQQAFSFYLYIRSICRLRDIPSPKILDFGGGWGRIARFFLRDTEPGRITVADCLSDSLHWLRETNNPCNVIKNDPFPPIIGLEDDFDVAYAYSVFSHLSEKYQNAWFDYLMACLRPGGHLVITTRGHQFLDILKHLHSGKVVNSLTTDLPKPEEIEARYNAGEFQFYPTGGGGELAAEFYGEAFIPLVCFARKYGSRIVAFSEAVEHVDQAVLVLRKPMS